MRTCAVLFALRYPAVTAAELEAQTQHLRARADKADSSSEALAQANAALAARDTQLQEATGEIERLGDLAQVCVCCAGDGGACGLFALLGGIAPDRDWLTD